VIAPNLRGYGSFFNFCDLIASYLEKQRIPLDHIISEITLDDRSLTSSVKPVVLVRMMRLLGFKAAKTAYWAPDPAILQDPDSCKAVLLFASRPEREDLPIDEFIRLVQLIYKTHYGSWYERTMTKDRFQRYQKAADGLLKKIQASTAKEKRIILNGMKNLDLVFSVDPNPAADASAFFYIGLLAIPATVGIAVAFTQELRVAAIAASVSIVGIGLFATHKKLRRLLMRAFQLK
jgi:hypothetical protein